MVPSSVERSQAVGGAESTTVPEPTRIELNGVNYEVAMI